MTEMLLNLFQVAHKRRVRAAEQAKQVKEILVASATNGNEDNIIIDDDNDEDGEDKDGRTNCFGSQPVSPSLMHGSIRSHSQQSFPSHPNSLNSDDERDHMGSDVEKDQRDEGKFFLLIISLFRCAKRD